MTELDSLLATEQESIRKYTKVLDEVNNGRKELPSKISKLESDQKKITESKIEEIKLSFEKEFNEEVKKIQSVYSTKIKMLQKLNSKLVAEMLVNDFLGVSKK